MKNYAVLLVMLAIGFLFASCSKDKQTQPAVLNIRLTDAPADYDAVNIEVLRVLVNADTDVDTGWIEMAVIPGIYNLLDFTAGNSTLIASASLNVPEIRQIRIILGNNNTVVVNGVETHLDTPGASQSGLKLKVNQTLTAGVEYTALLDFDASKSVVRAGASGKYILKPVIRLIFSANTGSIKGTIVPVTENCLVEVELNDSVSLSSYSHNGLYLIPGVPAGTYAVIIATPAESLYKGALIEEIAVKKNETTTVDKVVLLNKIL